MSAFSFGPFLKLYEELSLENKALRQTLADLPGWDDDVINANKEKHRPAIAAQFSALYRLSNNPSELQAIFENLQSKRQN